MSKKQNKNVIINKSTLWLIVFKTSIWDSKKQLFLLLVNLQIINTD